MSVKVLSFKASKASEKKRFNPIGRFDEVLLLTFGMQQENNALNLRLY